MEENIKKQDRRIIKSKKAIKKAFMSILATNDINDITIKNIADLADVDRKTVYNYYNGTYEILNEIENEMVSTINDAVASLDVEGNLDQQINIFKKITEVINENFEFYSILMKLNYDSQLIKKLISLFSEYAKKILNKFKLPNGVSVEFASTFIASGVLNTYYKWFNSERSISLDDLSNQLYILVTNSIVTK
ncbi:MAG: TetR/AcrR family transcriptional regulator [Acholeplasmatales bacterium]|nr:TetR/AcrR family transcriptional regulator [Acholeplasmatales bacterium]